MALGVEQMLTLITGDGERREICSKCGRALEVRCLDMQGTLISVCACVQPELEIFWKRCLLVAAIMVVMFGFILVITAP